MLIRRIRASRAPVETTTLSLLTLALAMPASLHAQEALTGSAQQGSSEATVREEIVVTGTRVIRDGYEAPIPVTVTSREDLEAAAPSTLSDALNQLPMFRGSGKPQNVNVASTGGNGGSFLNLRALGSQRTLVLLDGRRVVPSSGNGVPDTSILPQKLVERVEIVTGGASAAYGSDAVAGVVNFVLDTGFRGLKGDLQAGTSKYNDNDSVKASLTGGIGLADERGSAIFSAEFYESEQVDLPNGRAWAEEGWGLIPNTPGQSPRLVLRRGVTNSHATFGGLITSGPLAGTEFLPGGVPDPFVYGELRSAQYMVGGDGILDFINIAAGVERWSTFGRVGYEINDAVDVFVEASLAESRTLYRQRSPGSVSANRLEIFSGNAFLPASIQEQMDTLGINSFLMGRTHRDFGPIKADSTNRTWRVASGVDVEFGDGWTLGVSYTHGENNFLVYTRGNLNYRNLFAAVDAIRDPNGNIVCRSTYLLGLDPGCVPINLFGEGSPSREAIDYVTGSSFYDMTIKQDVAAAAVQGSPFSSWAGPVDVAFGVEYREESADQFVDEISGTTLTGVGLRGFPAGLEGNRGGWSHTNAQPIEGGYDIREAFFEAVVPLAKNTSFARSFDFNGAFRWTDYSTSGSVNTWKVGLTYEPIDSLRLRATRSRDIRAANIVELFTGSRQTSGTVREPGTGLPRNFVGSFTGNPDLEPEKADALTFGVVYRPHWLPGFAISIDYYDIKISGAISNFSAQETVDFCAAGSAVACQQITDNNGIYNIRLPYLNLETLDTRGIDIDASYRTSLFGGDLTVRAIINYTDRLIEEDAGGVREDRAGDVGTDPARAAGLREGVPKWGGTLGVNYKYDPVSVFVQGRYIHGGLYDRTLVEGVDLADNTIGSMFYTDLTIQYELLGGSAQLYATVNNLFDREPPIAPQQSSERFRASNFGLFDPIGRYYTAGVRFKF